MYYAEGLPSILSMFENLIDEFQFYKFTIIKFDDMKIALQIDITFEQILSIVKQLPQKQKILLSKELEKEAIDSKLTKLLKVFKSEELDLDLVDKEVDDVRKNIYDKHED